MWIMLKDKRLVRLLRIGEFDKQQGSDKMLIEYDIIVKNKVKVEKELVPINNWEITFGTMSLPPVPPISKEES